MVMIMTVMMVIKVMIIVLKMKEKGRHELTPKADSVKVVGKHDV